MQTGPSRELFELWCPDSRNGLIITGYSIEGTPARVSVSTILYIRWPRPLHVYTIVAIVICFLPLPNDLRTKHSKNPDSRIL